MPGKNIFLLLVLSLLSIGGLLASGYGQDDQEQVSIRGYLRAIPGVNANRDFSVFRFNSILNSRLNSRWIVNDNLYIRLEGRNRIIYNPLLKDIPGLAEMFDRDIGWVDLSGLWLSEGSWIGHAEIDRLYLNYRFNNWQFSAGRQRVNWGINMVSNPNDLFNTYSFFDFDYQERPGSDAIRIQYHTGFASRIEVAYSPARNASESVGALLWATNIRGYDFQTITGYFRNRAAIGLGWAGSIGGAGFKGEATWFYSLDALPEVRRATLVAATGLNYMLPNSTFVVFELLYNGGHQAAHSEAVMLDMPLRPDNIMFSEYAITLSLQHPFSPVFNGNLAMMALPDQKAFLLLPSTSMSLMTNLDFDIIAQIIMGGEGTIFQQAGSAWYVALKYSF